MPTITVQEAAIKLSELIHQLKPGEEVVITENNEPVAKLIGGSVCNPQPRQRGSAKGKLIIHAEDDQHLDDFKEFQP